MTDSHQGNIALHWASTFFRNLLIYGVRHVIISPGSRSTPLTLAAAINPALKKQVILDERSAAFTALGIGKSTNAPTVLVCTSGTALANYYPAVIEARESGIPLIVATADRPPYLHATGANQAIDQLKMFGDYPVFFHNVGEPREEQKDLSRLQMLAQQAVAISREKRGAVHLNFPFRKPLEPTESFLQNIQQQFQNSKEETSNADFNSTKLTLNLSLKKEFSAAQKPLIIVGPLAPKDDTNSISKLAKKLNAPILSEASISSKNKIDGFTGFLRNETLQSQLNPDLIIRFGFQPTSKSIELALKQWQPNHHFHFASTSAWQDATASGSQRISWMGKLFTTDEISANTQPGWISQWKEIEQQFETHFEDIISQQNSLTDGAIYHNLTPQLTDHHFVMASNSFPARDINLFGRLPSSVPLFVNRGASGIDGITSTAMGISTGLRKSGVLFTGDLAFLHDTNALLNHNELKHPLIVVVINNNGGSIFRMLPIAKNKEHFKTYFETPQQANISKLAEVHEIPHQKIVSLKQLNELSLREWTQKHRGLSIIECKTNAEASMTLRKKLWDFQ